MFPALTSLNVDDNIISEVSHDVITFIQSRSVCRSFIADDPDPPPRSWR